MNETIRSGAVCLLPCRGPKAPMEFIVLIDHQSDAAVSRYLAAPAHENPSLMGEGDVWIEKHETDLGFGLVVELWNASQILEEDLPSPSGRVTSNGLEKICAMRRFLETGVADIVGGLVTGSAVLGDAAREVYRAGRAGLLKGYAERAEEALLSFGVKPPAAGDSWSGLLSSVMG